MKKTLTLATACILALGLSACSSDSGADASTPEPAIAATTPAEAEPMDGDVIPADSDGDVIAMETLTFPNMFVGMSVVGDVRNPIRMEAPADPPEDIKQAQANAGDDDVTYVKVVVDNRAGKYRVDIDSVSISDADGAGYDFIPVDYFSMTEWATGEYDQMEYDESVDIPQEYDLGIEPGRIGTAWLASHDGLPKEATSMFVAPALLDAEPANMSVGLAEDLQEGGMFGFVDPNEN